MSASVPAPHIATSITMTAQPIIHPFETLLRGAREAGLKEGLEEGAKEKEVLLRRVIELEESLKGLRGQFSIAQERGAAVITRAMNESGVENTRLLRTLEKAVERNSELEERLTIAEGCRIAEVAVAKSTGHSKEYPQGKNEERTHPEQRPTPIISLPGSAHTTPTAHTSSPTAHYHHNSVHVRTNPWSSIARRHTRHSRTRTRQLRAKFFSKISDTNSSTYIIPSKRRTTSSMDIADVVSPPCLALPQASFLDILSTSLSNPSALFRGFRLS